MTFRMIVELPSHRLQFQVASQHPDQYLFQDIYCSRHSFWQPATIRRNKELCIVMLSLRSHLTTSCFLAWRLHAKDYRNRNRCNRHNMHPSSCSNFRLCRTIPPMYHLSCCRLLVVSAQLYYSGVGVALPKVLRGLLHSSQGMCVSATKDLLDVSG